MNTRSIPVVIFALCLALAISGPLCLADDDEKKNERRSEAAGRPVDEEGPGKIRPSDDPAKAGGVIVHASEVGVAGTDAGETLTSPVLDPNGNPILEGVSPRAEALAGTVSLSVAAGAEEQDPTLAVCDATGVDGAGGDDTITHSGPPPFRVEALSEARTDAVEVVLFSSGRGEAQTSAISTASGLLGGAGNDAVVNAGTMNVVADATAFTGGVAVTDKIFLEELNIPFSDTDVLARTETFGIRGDDGNDTIDNSGALRAGAWSDSHSLFVRADVDIESGSSKAESLPLADEEDDSDNSISRTVAEATVTGISGGAGDDTITSSGSIGPSPGGFKLVLNEFAAHADAVADSAQLLFDIPVSGFPVFPVELDIGGLNTQVEATSAATGISGGAGNDVITHSGSMTRFGASSNAIARSVAIDIDRETGPQALDIELSMQEMKFGVTSTAGFTGIDGGADDDTITNSGLIQSKARSSASSLSVSTAVDLSPDSEPSGLDFTVNLQSLDTTVDSEASAAGILGGTGNDTIVNDGSDEQNKTIEVTADSNATAILADLTLAGDVNGLDLERAMMDGKTTAGASAVGIDGGDGSDSVTTGGSIRAISDATDHTTIGSVTLSGGGNGLIAQASVADASSAATAAAGGLLGGEEADTLRNEAGGSVLARADSAASVTGINANVSGKINGVGASVAVFDSSLTSTANARGLDGGDGDDTILNSGTVTSSAAAHLLAAQGSINLGGSAQGVAIQGAAADSSVTAGANAFGLVGGAGADTVRNETGSVLNVTAESDAVMATFGVNAAGSVTGVGAQGAMVDTSTTAVATAIGIDGGEGDDGDLTNDGSITTSAFSLVTALSGSANVVGAATGVALEGAMAKAGADIESSAVGIDGGLGNDVIRAGEDSTTTVSSTSIGSLTSLQLNLSGAVTGVGGQAALGDASVTADASAVAFDGGDGDDTISGDGHVSVTATSRLDAASVSGNLNGATTGVGVQAGFSDLSATAETRAVAFDGGVGNDTIASDGYVHVNALSEVDADAVSPNVIGYGEGLTVQGAVADSSATARSTAFGMYGGSGTDTIRVSGRSSDTSPDNPFADWFDLGEGERETLLDTLANAILDEKDVLVTATSKAEAASTTMNLTGFNLGVSLQGAIANTNTVADAVARGIDGGDEDDTIENSANFIVGSFADTNAVATTVDVAIAVSGAVTSADVTAQAFADATGIDGGEGNDTITNSGDFWVQAGSTSRVANWNTSLNLVNVSSGSTGAFSFSDATGIRGGAGDDTIKTLDGSLIVANSQAMAESQGGKLSFSAISSTNQSARISARSHATGILGGGGNDVVTAAGDMLVRAAATAKSDSTILELSGSGSNSATLRATAAAKGYFTGSDARDVRNDGSLIIEAQADATSRAAWASFISGSTTIDQETISTANAWGIEVGHGYSFDDPGSLQRSIVNTGEVAVLDSALGSSNGDSGTALGNPTAGGRATATANAFGITSMEGHNHIRNEGTIAVAALANTSVSADTDTWGGENGTRSYSTKQSAAYGIVTGTGDDTIESTGTILVGAEAGSVDQASSDAALWGYTSAIAKGQAGSKAVGIQDWGGVSKIDLGETSVLGVKAFTYIDVQARSDETYIAEAGGWSEARGIVTGEDFPGDDTIHNGGTLAVSATTHVEAIAEDVDAKYEQRATVTGASAIATGISTFGGDDTIVNEGTITVGASTTYVGAPTGTAYPGAWAYAIDTGWGDDTVINRGTIIATAALTGGPGDVRSVAIKTGGGNDTVTLADGSLTTGDIQLDDGDDTLILQGSAELVGNINGGIGDNDTLVLENVPGVCMFATMPEEMEHLQLNDTTMWVMQGSVAMNPAGSCRTTLNSAGRTGQLHLLSLNKATLTLDGDIEVDAAPWAYADGDAFDIFTARNVNMAAGWDPADRVTLPESTALVSFDAGHTTDATLAGSVVGPLNIPIPAEALRVTAHVKPFASVADTEIEHAVAAALDATTPAAASDLSHVMGSIQLAAASQYDQAFASLSPDLYDGMTRSGMDAIRLESGVVEHRLDLARSAASFVTPGETPVAGTTSGGAGAAGAVALGNGAWLAGVGQSGSQDGAGGYAGYDYDTSGFALGYERAIEKKMIGGTLVSLSNTADFDGGRGAGEVDSLSGTVYGGFFPRKWFVQGALSYSGLSYGMDRGVQVGDLDARQARGEYDGSAISALATGGLAFGGTNWRLEPMANLWFASLSQDGFAETGAGDAGLVFDSRTTQSLVSSLGVRFEGNFWTKGGSRLMPEVALLGSYDLGIDDSTLDAGLVGGTGAPIVIEGQEVDPAGLTVGVGFSFVGRRGLGASIRYNRRVRGDWGANMLVVDIGYRF